MCFTFDHLLCPAHKAKQSCSDLTGDVLHGGCSTHEACGRTHFTGAEVAARVLVCRVRRALSTATPAMPFMHTSKVFMNTVLRRYDLLYTRNTDGLKYLSACEAFNDKKNDNFNVTVNK